MSRSIALFCFGLLAFGCSPDGGVSAGGPDAGEVSDDPEDPQDPEDHYLMPSVAYSGFDGSSTFKVPVYTTLEDAVFEIEDGAVAEVEPVVLPPDLEEVLGSFGRSWAMIITQQPGTTAFFATAGGVELEATLVVAQYDPDDVAIGAERYNEPVDAGQPGRIACQNCHGGPGGVDHTPLAMAYFEDHEILQVIVEGAYPDGGEVNDGNHIWDLTEAEAAGIVPYLRSLQPQGL
jgi:mono/diheme cytochrome c family protein